MPYIIIHSIYTATGVQKCCKTIYQSNTIKIYSPIAKKHSRVRFQTFLRARFAHSSKVNSKGNLWHLNPLYIVLLRKCGLEQGLLHYPCTCKGQRLLSNHCGFCGSVLSESNLIVLKPVPSAKCGAHVVWFSWERRHGEGIGVIVMIASSILPCPPYSVLGVSNEWNDLNAPAVAFGETRRIKRTEARRVFWGFGMIVGTILPCPPYSVLGVSNKQRD